MQVVAYSSYSPRTSNTFLIKAEREAIVDLGSNLVAAQLSLSGACCIILTHAHYDHTAALDSLNLPKRTAIMMHEADALARESTSISRVFGAPPPQFNVDILLKDNMNIDLGDISLSVIHTPGHTPGSICLYEPQSKGLFSGDTVFPNGGIGRTDLPGGSSNDIVDSISKLTEIDVTTLYPGHGPITVDHVNEQIKQSLNLARSVERAK
ncbi:MAG: MBL fold metallo-hydrolase [Halobacteriota archaeon]